ncbi:TetR/AcrR family transcriptional regulator [uncultured Enterovirga sp.]|uniref:TetR/AcrR family transcriptional regulator n=1 Tax=uncultured Enterovirga sp. TaxID=2026352 RepID=UPI0035CA09BB
MKEAVEVVPDRKRASGAAARREAIVSAALAEFSEKGFAATRMDDVAKRAGVAKGTIYLNFTDKQALFEGILQQVLSSAVDRIATERPEPDENTGAFLRRVVVPILAGLPGSSRGEVIRLMISEGARVPDLASIYFRTVMAPGLAALQDLGGRATARGEAGGEVLARFPQLLFAPALVGIVWTSLFDRHLPLDVAGLVEAQLDLIFPKDRSQL